MEFDFGVLDMSCQSIIKDGEEGPSVYIACAGSDGLHLMDWNQVIIIISVI